MTHPAHRTITLLPDLIEARASQQPNANAVQSPDAAMTYRDLSEQARSVAALLNERGIGPEDLVAICLPRGGDLVAVALGVLYAGAGYLPIDAATPSPRAARMVEDAAARLAFLDSSSTIELPSSVEVLTTRGHSISRVAGATPAKPSLRNIAYTIFTSGSSGTPKGVVIEHASLLSRVNWMRQFYALGPEDRVTMLASPGFDAAVLEVWPTLSAGGCVMVPDDETRLSPDALKRWIADTRVTMAFLPTPMAEATFEGPWPSGLALRALVAGGDRLRRLPRYRLPFRFVNAYGPTENTVVSTSGDVTIDSISDRAEPGIGLPVAETEVWILDDHLAPVNRGCVGHVYLGGPGLARGYLNSPALTAESFIPHLRPRYPGQRLYRTGDLAVELPDGSFAFRGRADEQIKISGVRIEPGEIDSTLCEHASVLASFTAKDPDRPILVSFVTLRRPDEQLDPHELQSYLRDRLPTAMVPARILVVKELPATPSGKVDKSRLLRLIEDHPRVAHAAASSTSETEAKIAGIWRSILRVDTLSTEDRFADLGGTSLDATQIVSRVNSTYPVEINLQEFFDAATVRSLASIVDARAHVKPHLTRVIDLDDHDLSQAAISCQQQQLLLLESMSRPQGVSPYHAQAVLELNGPLDIAVLEHALTEICRRHEILRTVYVEGERGDWLPVTQRPARVHVERVDFSHLDPIRASAAQDQAVADRLSQPFNLRHGPLQRWTVFTSASDRHQILLVEHHIVHDGWSAGLLLRELSALYNDRSSGSRTQLDDPAMQYGQYARWQRAALRSAPLHEQLTYWRAQLADTPSQSTFPPDHPRPRAQSFAGAVRRLPLGGRLSSGLREFARSNRVTLFSTMLSAFATLLHRYSGNSDLCIGSAFANRPIAEVEATIGPFVNTVILRCDVGDDPQCTELAQRVNKTVQAAAANQEYPFPMLVGDLRPHRDPAINPFAQVMFSFHDSSVPQVTLGTTPVRVTEIGNGSAKMDVNVTVIPRGEEITLLWEYATDLYDSQTIDRVIRHYTRLLTEFTARPNLALSKVEMLDQTEYQQLTREWATPTHACRRPLLIQDIVQDTVASSPDSVAVVDEESAITYRQFGDRVSRLARVLTSLGVGPDSIVGVCMERSTELVVAIHAILRAGGAFLPLDPAEPESRLRHIVSDSGAQVIVTQSRLFSGLSSLSVGLVAVETADAACERTTHLLSKEPAPGNLAYVIYTSGSTGAPKGVALPHSGLLNRLLWMQRSYPLNSSDRVLQKTPHTFDVSVWEFLWPLMSGASVAVAAPNGHRDPRYIADIVRRLQVTTLHFVPPMLRLFLDEPTLSDLKSIRRVFTSGQSLLRKDRDRFFEQLPHVELHNLYGPTEASIDVTSWDCRTEADHPGVPIGRPIENVETFVLDAGMQPVPPGVQGEIYLGGDCLARGYVGRPDLTAESFVPNPFSRRPGARMYRTGDFGKWSTQGVLHFISRVDDQVKVRGNRVEPNEVAAALREAPRVAAAHVAAHQDSTGSDSTLVAYFVARHGSDPISASDLREYLSNRLPAYMIPTSYVPVERLPLTRSGKVDSNALPRPHDPDPTQTGRTLNLAEQALATIWSNALEVNSVPVDQNFFDLGGNSLLLVKIHREISKAFPGSVQLIDLFEHPTIEGLAEFLTTGTSDEANAQASDAAKARRYPSANQAHRRSIRQE